LKRTIFFIFTLVVLLVTFLSWRTGLLTKMLTKQAGPEANVQMDGHQQVGTVPAEKPAQPENAPQEPPQETPSVEIPPDKQQRIGVRTVQVSFHPLKHTIRTAGLVEYDQNKATTINTKVEGWIERLYVNYVGAYFKKGQPLADLYSPELWATQQEFINVVRFARAVKTRTPGATPVVPGAPDYSTMLEKDADVLLHASRQRLRLWDISDAQIKRIEEGETPLRTLTIYSPVSGYVLQKQAVQGMKVMAGEKLFDVADLSMVWITADIYEYELSLIKVGDGATVQLSYLPGREFKSRIDYIYPTLTGETRTAKARLSIPNQGGLLKPQMFTNVELKIDLGKKLAVPEDALIDTGVRKIVYVDKGEGLFEPREVATGVQGDRLVEIISGLKVGDKIASSANFLIDSEAKLKGIEPLPRQKTGQGQKIPTVPKPAATPPGHQH
jgi:Cu(I)/Ag(I) efflux system membrane fusion protein